MPGDDGVLTPAEKQTISKWLNEKSRNYFCPVCNSNNWAIGDHLLSGMVYHGGGLIIGGASYPQFFLVCQNCAYTRNFMAVPVLGLVKEKGIQESKSSTSQNAKVDGDG